MGCSTMEKLFTKAELREINLHKYFLSQKRGYDVGFEAARRDWEDKHSRRWREARHRAMLDLQCAEIARHKWLESEKARRDLGREAALDWIEKYAAKWRKWYECEYDDKAC